MEKSWINNRLHILPETMFFIVSGTFYCPAGDDVLHRLRNGLKMMVIPHEAIASVAGSSFVIPRWIKRSGSSLKTAAGKKALLLSRNGCRSYFRGEPPLLFSRRAAAPTHLHPRWI